MDISGSIIPSQRLEKKSPFQYGLLSSQPGGTLRGRGVDVPVSSHPDDFLPAVLKGDQRTGNAGCVLCQPGASGAGGAEDTLLRQGQQLPEERKKVHETAIATSAIARHPGAASAGGVFDVSVGRIDPDQFRSESD